jgi:3-hydroxymyristoyl/3-hydroxydecanoyl-(acyl carrier protein) dehydratase
MTGPNSVFPSSKMLQLLRESARRSSSLHNQFLRTRSNSLKNVQSIVEMQIRAMGVPAVEQRTAAPAVLPARPAIFNSQQLDAFGVGRISDCLGPAFAKYDSRRIPRIPNGDLKMMSRVVEISGQPLDFTIPASIAVEYDVPANAWYFRDNAYPEMPMSVLMEIALQPCGFLSAYLDTYALVPHGVFYFRNLDGSLRWLAQTGADALDLRGKTITTRAHLLSSIASGETVIQKFSFELMSGSQPICQGESLFGYFSTESMASQVGLDGGRSVLPWLRTPESNGQSEILRFASQQPLVNPSQPHFRLSHGQLNLLDDILVVREGGHYGRGYAYARRPINPQDWFYPCHFYQDPVMPGSLGVEAILQAVQSVALASGLGSGFRSPRFGHTAGAPAMTWRYRGQITQQHLVMEIETHLREIKREAGATVLLADASLWVDNLRIYEIRNAVVGILEA